MEIIAVVKVWLLWAAGVGACAYTPSSAEPASCNHAVCMKRGREKAFSRAVDSS